MQSLHPQLQILIAELDSVCARARRLSEENPRKILIQRPAEGTWSVAECLEHLNITTREYLPTIDKALQAAEPTKVFKTTRLRKDAVGWLLASTMEPPYRIRMKTPSRFVPPSALDKDVVLGQFFELQGSLADRISRSSQFELSRIRIVSPFNGQAKYNLYSAYCILLAHQRRHLWQAEQVRIALTGQ